MVPGNILRVIGGGHSRDKTFLVKEKAPARAEAFEVAGSKLVPISFGLVGTVHRNTEILGLFWRQGCQLDANLLQVQPCHFLIQLLRQRVNVDCVGVLVLPEVELSQCLVREAVAHYEAGVTGCTSEVYQAAFGEHEDAVPRLAVLTLEVVLVDLRLDVDLLYITRLIEWIDLDLVVEVADVANDRLVFHLAHVLERDDIYIAGAGDVDVASDRECPQSW